MYNKIDFYRFLLHNGQEFYGKVLAEDGQKVIINTGPTPRQSHRVILYHSAVMLAEQLGWKAHAV